MFLIIFRCEFILKLLKSAEREMRTLQYEWKKTHYFNGKFLEYSHTYIYYYYYYYLAGCTMFPRLPAPI